MVLDAGVRERGQGPPAPGAPSRGGGAVSVHRYRWTILAVGVGAQTAISALRQGLPSLGPTLQSHFHLSLTQIGVVLGSVNVGIVLTLLAWGVLADRRGERPVATRARAPPM